jgi:hypothetical protein
MDALVPDESKKNVDHGKTDIRLSNAEFVGAISSIFGAL